MIKTVLFDLDGTLLPLDMNEFIKRYFGGLTVKFKDMIKGEELSSIVWASTKYMVENKEASKTNEEAFFEDFYKRVHHKPEVMNPLFEEYYIKDFCKVQDATRQEELMVKAVRQLKDKGYKVVVATNPIFPEIAIHQRIKWAGFEIEDFDFITTFEKMHFCKPNVEFYQEVLENIGGKPEDCLMVGNDVEEDMVAKQLGLTTFLIEDCIIHRGTSLEGIDYKGDYKKFYEFVVGLPSLK
ncbi:HAD family hydrolase [Alkaliphilus serpentinus]|uniref:HAD family hydrolase n=1 Tax=Alkaliphilus serpentinus TaxID=1482731 RepID=A0A833HMP7_9FIRM|nr:HAD family hydrolase [Alkaliphilus serpentinus]KAB3527647.1 HAD family hydrolase [Alkaliphilus serpentinus]